MKKFQKVTAMLLGLTMSVSLFACGGEGSDSSSKGKEPDNILGVELPGNLEEGEGKQYLDGAVVAFKEANTVTIEYTTSYSYSYTEKSPLMFEEETESSSLDVTFKATLAKTETGYNIAIEGNATLADDGETDNDPLKVYLVDGYVYNYDYDNEVWDSIALEELVGDYVHDYDVEPLADLEEEEKFPDRPLTPWATLISNAIMSIVSGDIAEADFSPIYDILGPVVEAFAFIENGEYKFNLDVKDDVTTALQTLANMDWTQTVETYINNVLKENGSDKTVKGILDEIAAYGAKTVGEIYKDFNESLKKETGKDLNGLKNELVSKLKNIDFTALEGYIPADELAEALAIINQIEATNFDEEIKPYEEMTIDELIPLVMHSTTITTLQSITDMIYLQIQTMSLQQALYSMGMNEIMDFAKEAKYITINDLSENLSIKFNGYKFSSLNFSAKVGGKYDNSADTTAMVKSIVSVASEMSCKVNFSNQTTALTPPVIAE